MPPDYEEAIACLTGMMEASGRANEVLDSTRGLFKTAAQQKTTIEINRLVQQVLRVVENDLRVQGVTVSTELQEDLPQIMGDRTLLQQAIINLVKNAVEAMGTVPTTIKTLRLVTTQDGNSVVSLSVQDSGPGINPRNGITYLIHFLRRSLPGRDWDFPSLGRSSRITAVICGSPRPVQMAVLLKSLCQV